MAIVENQLAEINYSASSVPRKIHVLRCALQQQRLSQQQRHVIPASIARPTGREFIYTADRNYYVIDISVARSGGRASESNRFPINQREAIGEETPSASLSMRILSAAHTSVRILPSRVKSAYTFLLEIYSTADFFPRVSVSQLDPILRAAAISASARREVSFLLFLFLMRHASAAEYASKYVVRVSDRAGTR